MIGAIAAAAGWIVAGRGGDARSLRLSGAVALTLVFAERSIRNSPLPAEAILASCGPRAINRPERYSSAGIHTRG